VEAPDEVGEPLLGAEVHAGERLVHDEERRSGDERTSDQYALLLAPGKVDERVVGLLRQSHPFDDLADAVPLGAPKTGERAPRRQRARGHELADRGRVHRDGGPLRHVPQLGPGTELRQRRTQEADLAALVRHEAEHGLDQRGLSRAVAAQESDHLVLLHGERDVAEDRYASQADAELVDNNRDH
jgi:hypothetical protein